MVGFRVLHLMMYDRLIDDEEEEEEEEREEEECETQRE